MNITRNLFLFFALGTAAAAQTGINVGINLGGAEISVSSQPPPLRAEPVAPFPGPGYIWIRGHWTWRHENWEWIDGHWDRVPQYSAVWVPGQWVVRNNLWVWAEGHYTPVLVPPPPPPGQQVEVVAAEEPPADILESQPAAPGPDYFWVGGHWHWRGGWVWIGGRYEHHPDFHPGARWVAGHWERRDGSWVWREGHFAAEFVAPPNLSGPPVEVIASEAPPADIVEVQPPVPGADYFWVGGHWHWNHGWVWINGRFERHPEFHGGERWEAGKWERRGGSWVWREGHFANVSAPAPSPGHGTEAIPAERPQAGPAGSRTAAAPLPASPAPARRAEGVATERPPADIAESRPASPGPEYFWIPGHWHWGGSWAWVRGHYDRHPHYHPGAYWEAGRWEHSGGTWVWREGSWH